MVIDPLILARFGQPPDGIDLSEVYMRSASALVITLSWVAVLATMMRFGARYLQHAGLEADDYVSILALIFAIPTCAMVVKCRYPSCRTEAETLDTYLEQGAVLFEMEADIQVSIADDAGGGKHVWALNSEQVELASKYLFFVGIFCSTTIGATKSSILLLYVRIFSLNDRTFKCLVYVGAVLTVGCALSTLLMLTLSCRPVYYFWARYGPDEDVQGSCGNAGAAFFAIGVINLFLEFYLLAIPIPQILKLNMSSRRKSVLCALILIGIFVCGAGVVRNYYLVKFNPAFQHDYTWGMQPANVWVYVEATLGIICACLANVTPLYVWVHGHVRSVFCRRHRGRAETISDGSKPVDRNRLPSYIEAKLVLRPKKEDEIRLTTLAMTGRDRNSDEDAQFGDGIVVRSEITQVVHDGDGTYLQTRV